MAQKTRSRFVWHELMTSDTTSAAALYTRVNGWKTESSPRDPSYTLFAANGRPVAGLMGISAEARAMGAPPSWLSYIGTGDVDATARQAESLGAKILKAPTDIPTVGRFAVIQDPQGAVFAAFTPAPGQPPPTDADPAVGEYSWHELMTTDSAAAFAFYQRLFGWESTGVMDMGPQGAYQMFGFGKKAFGGLFTPSQMMGPPSWLAYVRVSDAKKTADAIRKAGAQVINGPMEVPDGDMIAQAVDLQGAMFAIHSKKPAPAAKAAAAKAPAAKPAASKAARPASRKAKAAKARPRKAAKAKAVKPRARRPAARAKARAGRRATRRRGSRRR